MPTQRFAVATETPMASPGKAPPPAATLGHPEVEALVEEFDQRAPEPLTRRERLVETAVAVGFVAVALPLALLVPWQAPFHPVEALGLVAAYAVVSRVKFTIGYGYTVPTQLIFVPMLLLLPAPVVPLLVAAASVIGNLPDYLGSRAHPSRALLAIGDSWHALGPALVLVAAGVDGPSWSLWPVYLAALAAQFAFDFTASTVREWLWLGVSPRLQGRLLAWLFLVDLMLSPIGLLAALAATETRLAPFLTLPLAGLLSIFARERRQRLAHAVELSRAYRGTTLLLSDVLEADDQYTGVHSRSVVLLAVAVADEMGLDARERRKVEFGALLHDVGKIATPKPLINKRGPLTTDEWQVVKAHTVEGQRMLDRVGGLLSEIGSVVRSSHERWDGTGYPDGLAGEAIPLTSTIVCACDAFNAMTTDRSYRSAMSVDEALTELQACAGSQFNPAVVEVLVRLVRDSVQAADAQASAPGREARAKSSPERIGSGTVRVAPALFAGGPAEPPPTTGGAIGSSAS